MHWTVARVQAAGEERMAAVAYLTAADGCSASTSPRAFNLRERNSMRYLRAGSTSSSSALTMKPAHPWALPGMLLASHRCIARPTVIASPETAPGGAARG